MKNILNNSNRLALFMAIVVLAVGSIGATTLALQQQASAFIIEGSKIAEFQILTAKMEKAVIQEGPAPHLIGPFAKLTDQLRRDVINADDISAIRGVIVNWHDAASRIFLGGPDTIPPLLDDYRDAVLRLFGV